MNLLALVKYLRTSILDDTGGTGVDWTCIQDTDDDVVMLRWSNEELTSFINEALRQVYRRILPVKDSKTFDITVVAGTSEYSLDSRIIQLIRSKLTSNGQNLSMLDIEDIWDLPNWEDQTGTPFCVIPNYDSGNITLYPEPVINDTLKVLVYRFPLAELEWLSNTVSADLRTEFLIPMLNYAAFLAYGKDEENTEDSQQAGKYLGLFNQEFPQTSAYSDNRKRKTTNRAIAYGGLPQRSSIGRLNRYGNLPLDPYF